MMHDMRNISLYNALFNYFIKVTRYSYPCMASHQVCVQNGVLDNGGSNGVTAIFVT